VIRYVATNLTDLHKEPTFLSELLTQVTNGVALEVLHEEGKWCRVRQTDRYEGWAYAPYLTDVPPPTATHIVAFPMVALCAEPSVKTAVTRLLAGTKVRVVESKQIWQRVELAGERFASGWVLTIDDQGKRVRPLDRLPLAAEEARNQILEDARKFTGTYYLWGGGSAWGIDCSGLAQLAHRLSGYEIPRDCVLQYPCGRPVKPPFTAGDLLYFWNEARTKVGHVGISLGEGWRIIHSSRKNNGVYEEDVQANQNLRESYAGARTFLP
jgi:gamma-D-glutamyl-L-lysine dipeptidyl-peptidase